MRGLTKRTMPLVLVLALCLSLLSGLHFDASAATVDYVTGNASSKYTNVIKNWGTRGTTATFLSPNAEAFYEDNHITYEDLATLSGASSTSSVPSSALFLELKELVTDNQTKVTSYADTKDLFAYTDCQGSGVTSAKISSFYSGTPIGPSWDGGWNREHTWPNSKGDANGSGENDIMMLRPTSTSENSSRGNTAYGESSSYYHPNEESNGAYDLRGDVARIVLYVYTRWGTQNMWGSSGVIESKEVLLKWMEEDPVDTWELGRNDSTESIIGTRNVYVDYPELAFLLFNEEVPVMETPSGIAANGTPPATETTPDPTDTTEDTEATVPVSGEATISFADTANRVSFSTTQQVWAQNGIAVTNDKASSGNDVADYSGPVRFYKSSKLTIAAEDMVKIEVNCNKTSYAADLVSSIPDTQGVTVTADGKAVTVEFAAATDSFVIESLYAQVRVDSITVYTAAQEPEETESTVPDTEPTVPDTEPTVPETQPTETSEATISFVDTANRVSFSTTQQVWEQNGITVTNDKSESSSNVADYCDPVRFYSGSSLTVEAEDMVKIVFNCNTASYATALANSITGATVTTDGKTVTVELAAAADSFVIESLSAQVRVDSITVYKAVQTPVEPEAVTGDFTGDAAVTNDDVVYLLWHVLFPEEYPIAAAADFTGDGAVTNDDVIVLLWHVLFPEEYPL